MSKQERKQSSWKAGVWRKYKDHDGKLKPCDGGKVIKGLTRNTPVRLCLFVSGGKNLNLDIDRDWHVP